MADLTEPQNQAAVAGSGKGGQSGMRDKEERGKKRYVSSCGWEHHHLGTDPPGICWKSSLAMWSHFFHAQGKPQTGPREKGCQEETEGLVSGREMLVMGPRVGSPLAHREPQA